MSFASTISRLNAVSLQLAVRLDERPMQVVIIIRLCFMMSPLVNMLLAMTSIDGRTYIAGSCIGLLPLMTALVRLHHAHTMSVIAINHRMWKSSKEHIQCELFCRNMTEFEPSEIFHKFPGTMLTRCDPYQGAPRECAACVNKPPVQSKYHMRIHKDTQILLYEAYVLQIEQLVPVYHSLVKVHSLYFKFPLAFRCCGGH